MNAGFSNLDFLKKQLLAPALRAGVTYDDQLVALGQGVMGMFERLCNRDFAYQAGAQEVAQGDRSFWYVRRTPVTQFTKVELRFFRADDWTDITGQPLSADEEKGLIHFGYTLGRSPIQFRVTYNGGYFWNTLEPGEAKYPATPPDDITSNPAGIAAEKFNLPPDLLLAWILQCKHGWQASDPKGTKIVDNTNSKGVPQQFLGDLDLLPQVKAMLQPHVRYQLT